MEVKRAWESKRPACCANVHAIVISDSTTIDSGQRPEIERFWILDFGESE